jgi:hypothetical protein
MKSKNPVILRDIDESSGIKYKCKFKKNSTLFMLNSLKGAIKIEVP